MFSDILHIVVAVIIRNDYVLISKREKKVHQGNLWEFPGGKVEINENAYQALLREVKEELAIDIQLAHPLIKVKHCYPDKAILLDVWLVDDFKGKKYFQSDSLGSEDQLVKWVSMSKLADYSFPLANKAIINALKLPEYYLITPNCQLDLRSIHSFIMQFSQMVEQYPLIQLRLTRFKINTTNTKLLTNLVIQLCHIANNHSDKTQLLVNSSIYIYLTEEVQTLFSGLHLTSFDLQDAQINSMSIFHLYRQKFPEKIISASCHDKKDIELANKLDLNFIVLSPILATQSHPEQFPMGWKKFKILVNEAKMPVFALGGMSTDNLLQAQKKGGRGIAAIRGLWNELIIR
jgi:8-oxo-dGTP diphosphatase